MGKKEVAVVNCDDEEEDWLPPPLPQNRFGVEAGDLSSSAT